MEKVERANLEMPFFGLSLLRLRFCSVSTFVPFSTRFLQKKAVEKKQDEKITENINMLLLHTAPG